MNRLINAFLLAALLPSAPLFADCGDFYYVRERARASAEYNARAADFTLVRLNLMKELYLSADYKAMIAEFRDAKDAYEIARRPVLEQLHDSSEYNALTTRLSSLQKELECAQANKADAVIVDTANRMLTVRMAISDMERRAMDDPAVADARHRFILIARDLNDYVADYRMSISLNPDWLQARSDMQAAWVGYVESAAAASVSYSCRNNTFVLGTNVVGSISSYNRTFSVNRSYGE